MSLLLGTGDVYSFPEASLRNNRATPLDRTTPRNAGVGGNRKSNENVLTNDNHYITQMQSLRKTYVASCDFAEKPRFAENRLA